MELYVNLLILKNTAFVVCSYTDEEQVKGLCGLHVEYDTEDRDSDRKMYPWLAYVNVQVSISLKKKKKSSKFQLHRMLFHQTKTRWRTL